MVHFFLYNSGASKDDLAAVMAVVDGLSGSLAKVSALTNGK